MRAIVARALRTEALSAAPPPRDPGDPQLVHNRYRFTDSDGAMWGDARVAYYRDLKRVRRDNARPQKRARKERKPGTGGSPAVAYVNANGEACMAPRCQLTGRGPNGERRIWRGGEALIVINPIVAIAKGVDFKDLNRLRARYGVHGNQPKHWLDWVAQGGT